MASAAVINALQTLVSRETNPANAVVISICTIHAGEANNIVPDSVEMTGTVRTLNPADRDRMEASVKRVAASVAEAYRCTAEITFSDYCPCMVVDKELAGNALTYMTELLGKGAMDITPLTGGKPGGGSEDFAFVSHEVPTCLLYTSPSPRD